MATIVFDVEANGLLDTATRVHCIVMRVIGGAVGVFVNPEHLQAAQVWCSIFYPNTKIKCKLLGQLSIRGHRLVGHNALGYDFPLLRKCINVDLERGNETVDTLVLSRFLNPERPAHGLKYWGETVFKEKMPIDDWSNLPIEDYLTRCAIDVDITERVYRHLRTGLSDRKLHQPFRLAQVAYRDMAAQERDGAAFDLAAAKTLLGKVKAEMTTIAAEVEPEFGVAPRPKSQQPTFPKKPRKKNGELSATAWTYAKNIGVTEVGELIEELNRGPKILTAPIRLDNQAQVKEYLFHNGWQPTIWRMNDITRAGKVRENSKKKRARAMKYVKDAWGGPYRECVWRLLGASEELRVPYEEMDDMLKGRAHRFVITHGRALPMSPQFSVTGPTKTMCPNLEKMQGPVIRKIIHWMSMKNRRGVLSSWIAHPRIKQDSRLPAGSSGLTNTYRQRHVCVVNVPKADPRVLFGKEMRSLFIAPKGYVCIGCDASGLEARLAGHLAAEFDDGAYTREILEGDIHIKNAKAYSNVIGREVSRSDGKSPTYALMFGASSKKLALMFDVSIKLGEELVTAFWDANPGLAAARDNLTQNWHTNGRKFIRSLDGRKIATRSQHSLLNAAIQSSGAVIMDSAWQFARRELMRRFGPGGKDGRWQRWAYMHDEYQCYSHPDIAEDVGKAIQSGIIQAGEFFKLRVPMAAEYQIGPNWAETH